MSPLLPAVRAHHAERHPALDVGIPRDPHDIDPPSPGAGSTPDSDPDWDWDEYDELPDPDLLQPSSVTVTEIITSTGVQGPTTVTVVQVSPVPGLPTIPLSFSSPVPSSTPPAVITPSDTSSSPPATNTSTFTSSTTTPQDTGRSSQGPTTSSATAAATENPLRNGSTGGVRKSSGLSGGAIAAVVIVLLLAMGALVFLLLRRRRIQRRTARRATWTANAWQPPTADGSLEKAVTEINPTSLSDIGPAAGAPSSSTRGNEGGAAQPPAIPIILRKSPPTYIPQTPVTQQPPSYFSPVDSSAPSPQPSAARTMGSESTQYATVLVRVTFVPQLPDELAITPGETLYIRTEFDDGWAYCANIRGEEGMVPLECLEGAGGQFAEFPPSVDWHNRDSRRVSSLRSPHSPVA